MEIFMNYFLLEFPFSIIDEYNFIIFQLFVILAI